MTQRPRVVVVGAGFAGISCARKLAKAPVDVTLIYRRNHHLFQPLLYQVATAALAPADVAQPIRHPCALQRTSPCSGTRCAVSTSRSGMW